MSINEMESKIKDLRELKRMQEDLGAEIAAIEDELKQHMTSTNTDEIHGSTFKITWKPVTSTRLDSKAVKAANPTLWEMCSKQTTSRRFILA